jgi:hypothetical protein
MGRKKRPVIALVERALEAFEGRLVSVKSKSVLKVTAGAMDEQGVYVQQPEYIVWEPGEIGVFTGLGKGRSAAGNTRGWAQILLKGRLGYMQPSQLRHLILEEDGDLYPV